MNKLPKVDVTIRLPKTEFTSTDSIKVVVTIRNIKDKPQKVLFGKKSHYDTNGFSAYVENIHRQSVTEIPDRTTMLSYLHFEDEFTKKGYFSYLKPNEKDSHEVLLSQIMIFNFKDNQISPGYYKLRLNYWGNPSNQVMFKIRNRNS